MQDSLTGSQEVSVAIGIQSCVGRAPAGTCDGVDTSGYIGTSPLYVGPYTPEIVPGGHSAALVQNFTVTVPDYLQPGAAVIAVAHFSLILVSGPGNLLLLARGKESTDEWFFVTGG